MKSRFAKLVASGLLFLVCLLANRAEAYDYPWLGGWGGNGLGFQFGSFAYSTGRIPTPPYFSIHPPVHYSGVIRRPYGDSPYAQPPSRLLTDRSTTVIVVNPYVSPSNTATVTAVATPLVVENPYYQPAAIAPPTSPASENLLPPSR